MPKQVLSEKHISKISNHLKIIKLYSVHQNVYKISKKKEIKFYFITVG